MKYANHIDKHERWRRSGWQVLLRRCRPWQQLARSRERARAARRRIQTGPQLDHHEAFEQISNCKLTKFYFKFVRLNCKMLEYNFRKVEDLFALRNT